MNTLFARFFKRLAYPAQRPRGQARGLGGAGGLSLWAAASLAGCALATSHGAKAQPVVAQTCQKLVATGNPEYSPYLWRDPLDVNRLMGANADLMQLLASEIAIPIEVKYVGPWSRVQELARTGRVDLVAGAFITTARQGYMDYFQPAFRGTRTVIWTPPQAAFPYKEWPDLKGKSGLTVVNNSFGEDFDAYAKKALRIDTVASLEQALKMVVLGRADYLIYEEDPGLALAAKLNITSLVTAPVAITTEDLYLTMSHQSPCNTVELRGRITQAMQKLIKSNTMKNLVATNIGVWQKQNKK